MPGNVSAEVVKYFLQLYYGLDQDLRLDPRDLLLAPFPKTLRLRREVLAQLSIDPAHPALIPFRTQAGTVEWRTYVGLPSSLTLANDRRSTAKCPLSTVML